MNRLTIIGNICANVELKHTPNGDAVCNFSVAVNRRKTNQDGSHDTDFFRVTVWRQLAENCAKFLNKGRKVAVVGPVSVRTYQANDGTTKATMEVTAIDVEFLSPRNEQNADSGETVQPNMTPVDTSVELPF